jgi:DNA-binding transcriptional LysR family regulator
MHISRIDLNLFVIFEAVYTEKSVTRASRRLNLTQPAISHALGRLRTMFNDPLFIRQGKLMVSTPLARSIIDPVRAALRGFEGTLNRSNGFEPGSSERSFTLGLRDVLEATVLPPLMARIAPAAPHATVAAVQVERREIEGELQAGSLDCAIDVLLPFGPEIRRERILADRTLVVARRGHPALQGAVDLDTYLRQDHVLVSSRRKGPGVEDFELSRLGLSRRVRLRCQHYFAACRVVSQTDLILTMPERYARVANQQFDNQLLPLPLAMPAWDVYLYWHANMEQDPANRWLREQVTAAVAG